MRDGEGRWVAQGAVAKHLFGDSVQLPAVPPPAAGLRAGAAPEEGLHADAPHPLLDGVLERMQAEVPCTTLERKNRRNTTLIT